MQTSKDTTYKALIREGKDLQKKLKETAALLVSMPDEKQGITRQKNVMRKYYMAYRSLTSSYEAPNETQKTHYKHAHKALKETLDVFHELFTKEVEPFKEKVGQMPPKWFKEYEKIEI
jgi:predicted metal-dependent enzyme (double-stranded beta helix superfamily)